MAERLVSLTLSDGSRVSDCPLALAARDMAKLLNLDSVNQFHRWRHRVGLSPIPGTHKYSTVCALNLLSSSVDQVGVLDNSDPGIAALNRAGL